MSLLAEIDENRSIKRVAQVIYDELEGPVANQDATRQLPQWEMCIKIARSIKGSDRDDALKEALEIVECSFGSNDRMIKEILTTLSQRIRALISQPESAK